MATDNEQRFSAIEKDLAVLTHRVREVENTPTRVATLEQAVSTLQAKITMITADIEVIKQDGKELQRMMQKIGEDVRRLFFIGTVIASLAGAILIGFQIYEKWNNIQIQQTTIHKNN